MDSYLSQNMVIVLDGNHLREARIQEYDALMKQGRKSEADK